MEEMSKSEFLNEDGHGGVSELAADAYSWWLTDRLKQAVGEALQAARAFHDACPERGRLAHGREVELEGVIYDLLTDFFGPEIAAVSGRLADAGHSGDTWEPRAVLMERQARLLGGGV